METQTAVSIASMETQTAVSIASMETQTAVTEKSLYACVNSFLMDQWIGQVILNLASSCLVGLVAWAWHKSNGGQLETKMLQKMIIMHRHIEHEASQRRRLEAELKQLQTTALNSAGHHESVGNRLQRRTSAKPLQLDECVASRGNLKVAEIDITVVIDTALTAGELQNVRSAMPSDQATEISGSHVFQTSISFEEGHLVDRLRGLLENLASTESCTIQLGHWGVFDQGENRLERFMEENLPILVMCTRIADAKISICGSHLKGEGPISVYAATAERKLALDVTWDEDEILPGVERGVASLPSEFADIGDIWIYATKTVPAGEARKPTTFRSQAIPLRNIEHVAPLKWPFILLLLVYELVFFNGVLQALVVASVWLTTWGLFRLRQSQLTRRRSQSTNSPWQVLIRVAGTMCKLGLLPFALLKNTSWGRENSSNSQRGLSINSDTTEIIQTEDQASLTQATHDKMSEDIREIRSMIKLALERNKDDADVFLEKLNADADVAEEDPDQELEAPDWKWPRYETVKRKGRQVRKGVVEHKKTSERRPPFIVTQQDHGDGDVSVVVTLYSSWLTEIVKQLLPDTAADTDINAQTLFLALDEMEKVLRDATGKHHLHLRHLVRFVKEEYKTTLLQHQQALEQKSIAWDILWTLLVPGEVVSYQCKMTTQQICGNILKVNKLENKQAKFWFWRVHIGVRDFDLQSYKECSVTRDIVEYTDKQPFSSLEVVPLKYLHDADRKQREERLLRQGEMFYRLMLKEAGQPLYMEYKGSIAIMKRELGCWVIKKDPGDGRVMVDLRSFARMNPGYPMGNAEPPCDLLRGAVTCPQVPRPHIEQLKRSPAFVYGFSFSRKQWGCFDVCGFSSIVFSNKNFEDLVMEKRKKDMLLNIVTNCTLNQSLQQVDSIANKGSGCIILCYGPPGSGKTLTAELLAEVLHRPLYTVNAFELPSTDSSVMEARLLTIFELSYTWRAILLLDEADVYMEKRSPTSSTHQNASTGVFLRQLEYYSGIMFLTTNRAKCFDAAFRSRIAVSIYYPPLDQQQRAEIWRQMLNKVGLQDGGIDFFKLASHPFHGREIRNIINVAKLWGGKGWGINHVNEVINMKLNEATLLDQIEDTT